MPSCQLETHMHHVTRFYDKLVLTDMLLQVRYSCGEGGQEAILSIKVHFLIVVLPTSLVCGLTSRAPFVCFHPTALLHHRWS